MRMLLAGFGLLAACTGSASTDEAPPDSTPAAEAAAPAELVAESWQVRLTDAGLRQRFESSPAWGAYYERDLPQAVASMGDDSVGLARMHAEYAALYRQALLLYAHSVHHVYGDRLQETDPVAVPYLRGAGNWFLGEDGAAEEFGKVAGAGEEIEARAAAWAALAEAGWPVTIPAGVFPEVLPDIQPGTLPKLTGLPHYTLPEQSEDALAIETADPMALLALAQWHEAAARQAAGDAAEGVGFLVAPWRLPVEPDPDPDPATSWDGEVDDGWMFAGFFLTPQDAAFVADGSVRGAAAVADWADRSPIAAAIAPAVVDGNIAPEQVFDQAAALEAQVMAAMEAKAGLVEGYHQGFASLAELGVLRAAMVVADANDQYRDAGVLRLNALDLSSGPGWDPVFVLSVAAWSAGNENTVRAEELVHKLSTRYPAVDAARYPLDALHIRRSRGSMQIAPAH